MGEDRLLPRCERGGRRGRGRARGRSLAGPARARREAARWHGRASRPRPAARGAFAGCDRRLLSVGVQIAHRSFTGREQRSADDRRQAGQPSRRHDGLAGELAKEGPPLERLGRLGRRPGNGIRGRVRRRGVVSRIVGSVVAHVARNLAGEPPTRKARRDDPPRPECTARGCERPPDRRSAGRPTRHPSRPTRSAAGRRGRRGRADGSAPRRRAARCGGSPTRSGVKTCVSGRCPGRRFGARSAARSRIPTLISRPAIWAASSASNEPAVTLPVGIVREDLLPVVADEVAVRLHVVHEVARRAARAEVEELLRTHLRHVGRRLFDDPLSGRGCTVDATEHESGQRLVAVGRVHEERHPRLASR